MRSMGEGRNLTVSLSNMRSYAAEFYPPDEGSEVEAQGGAEVDIGEIQWQ